MNYKDLVSSMTLEEKCSLLSGKSQFTSQDIPRLGIPSMYLSDGPHGVRKQAGAADHLGLNPSLQATCYPTSATMANAWDVELGEQLGQYLGAETAAQGVNVLIGPGLNIKRSPLCGRNFEYFSEDPYLSGKMAASYVRGIQAKGVAACPKHYAANSQETRRLHNDSVVDERALREIYLTGFEIAVKEGKPLSIMSAYNKINGTYANEHKQLMQDILVEDWGFDGFVVTDWGGSNDRVDGLVMGNQLEMPATNGNSDREVEQAVADGRISESLVDQRVEEFLRILFSTQLPKDVPDCDWDAHHAFARKAAESTIVLLKNDDGILPLKAGTRVAVIGDFAETPRYQGAGSSAVNPTKVDTALGMLMNSGLDVVGFSTGFNRHGGEDASKLQAAVKLAAQVDVVLLYMGLDEILEVEGMDRANMRIRRNQVDVLKAIKAVNSSIVVVLSGGAPIELPWYEDCTAIIHGYLGGQAGAGAMVDALLGKITPSGKLAETWPMKLEDTPCHKYFPGQERTAEYRESVFVGYRYYETAGVPVRFPFGYGLSYTTFDYSGLQADESGVSLTVTNTGAVSGAEVVQVYIAAPEKSSLFRPVRELKAFTKIALEPGESKIVHLPLDERAFRYFNVETGRYEVEGGLYAIQIGASVADIRLEAEVHIEGSNAPLPYSTLDLGSYQTANILNVGDEEFSALLGRPIPEAKWDRTKPLGINDTFSQLFYAKRWIGRLVCRVLTHLKNRAEKKGTPDLNILFIYNLPFRGVAKMMGGAVDMPMAESLLEIFNGHFFKGAGHLIAAWFRKRKAARHTKQKLADATITSAINQGDAA